MPELEQALLRTAQGHYEAGRLSAAARLYRQVLVKQPRSPLALSWLAVIAEQMGNAEESIDYYQQVLVLEPDAAEMHSNLGALLGRLGRIPEAIAHQRRAVELLPRDPEAHYNLGVVLAQAGELAAALTHYRRAIALNPKHAYAHNNLGVALCQAGQPQEAIAHYKKALMYDPNHANAHHNFGIALFQQGDVDGAIAHYRDAIALQPNAHTVYDSLATALKQQGKLPAAIAHYQHAISLNPDYANAYDNLAIVFQAQGNLVAAIEHYRKAIAANPNYANAYSNLGSALKEQNQLAAAIAACEQALTLEPDNADFHNIYAGVLAERGEIAAAIVHFEAALRHKPENADIHLNLGMMLLTLGDFSRGFQEYHWRWQTHQCSNLRYPEALWDGANLQGRVILLTAEQGFGDTIQFARYAPLVAQRGGQVVIACPKALVRLLETLPGIDRCVERDRVDVQTHVHAPLLELPRLFSTTLETIPAEVPYLSPPVSDLVLPACPQSTRKIGIVWATNPANSTSPKRSCCLAHFLELLNLPDLALYSLQKDPSPEDLALIQANDRSATDRLFNLSDQLGDFGDTAAAIAQLDLIISVDTAVAHLAGALGKPVWTLLPFCADWRWLRDRPDSPWYPTMRLFRQPQPGDWQSVFAEVVDALQVNALQAEQAIVPASNLVTSTTSKFLVPKIPAIQTSAALSPVQPAKPAWQLHYQQALTCSQTGQTAAAIYHYQQTIVAKPDHAIAHNNLATLLMRQGDLTAAVAHYQQAIALDPAYANAYSNLAIALLDQGQPEAAIPHCQRAIELQPNFANAYNSYGCALIELGRVEQAIVYYRHAIEADANHQDAHLNLGMTLLLLGNFQQGFVEYHWRWRNKPEFPLRYPEALWDGGDLTGKTILLTAEQGFGDTIQFVRYASLVAERGGRVVLACQKSLLRLLRSVPGIHQCIDRDTEQAQTHVHAPLLELPRILNTTLETIPAPIPYLTPPPTSFSLPILPSPHLLKIGIAWSVSPTSGTFRKRSCPLQKFLSLLEIPEVALYSLQKSPPEADYALLQATDRLTNLDQQLVDFGDTAAAIVQLDLIITVDTAVGHLAGALGKPVWTLLPMIPDWRWLLHREESPWYPTMRLFRQQRSGDWAGVMARVVAQVRSQLAEIQPIESVAPVPPVEPLETITAPEADLLSTLNSARLEGDQQLRQLRHGVFLDGNDNQVARSQAAAQAHEAELLQHLISPGDWVVDGAAATGWQTVFFAKSVGTSGRVVAIEPHRLVFQRLCANLALNNLTNVHAYQIALGKVPGVTQLPGVNGTIGSVQTATLDRFALPRCRLLRLHQEALFSLEGGISTLKRCQPIVYFANVQPLEGKRLLAWLRTLGYQGFWHSNSPQPRNASTNLLCLHPNHGIDVHGLEPVSH
jgi:tetratricopeptide (TPR) repeat protein